MKIGIISDTHENVKNILLAVEAFKKEKVKTVIHCGDVIAPLTLRFFEGVDLQFISGNNDGDIPLLKEVAEKLGFKYLGDHAELEIDDKKIAVIHGQDAATLKKIIESGSFDFVFTGHTHKVRDDTVGGVRVLNPGSHYWNGQNTIMVLDTGKNQVVVTDLYQEADEDV